MSSRMRSRAYRWTIAASIVIVGVQVPQRAGAQWRSEVLVGLRFGPPLRAGAAVAVAYGGSAPAGEFAGLLGVAEAGVGGARGGVGYLWAGPFASGISVLGSAIRTWGSPSQVEANRTLAGGEVRLMFFVLNVGAAAYRPVGGPRANRKIRYFLNVGLGV